MSIVSKQAMLFTAVLFSILGVSSADAQTTTLPTLRVNPQNAHKNNKKQVALSVELSQKEIKQSGSTSVTDLIRKQGIAHIQAGSGNPNQTMVSMDGFGNNASSNALMLIDGIPITSFTNVGPNLNNVIIDNVYSLSIQPGSYGVLYGSQAVSGVINIKTHNPNKTLFRGNLGIGNMHQVMAGVFASARPVPQWGYNVGLQSDYNHHDTAYNKQQNTTFNLNIHHYGLNNLTTANILSYINNSQMPKESIWRQPGYLGSPKEFTMNGNIFYLTNKHLFNIHNNLQTRLAVYQTSLRTSSIGDSNSAAQIDQRGLYVSNQWHHVKGWLLGLDNRYNNYNADLYGMKKLKAEGNIVSPYIRKKLHLTSQLSSTLGIRYAWQYLTALGGAHNIRENNHIWANEESLTDHLNKHWQLTLRHDRSYAFATGKDVLWRIGENNPALKTQTGDQYDFNIHWQKDGVSSLLSLYEINLQNEMAIRFPKLGGISEIYNLPSTRRRGVSIISRWHFNPKWSLQSQITYVDPRLTDAANKNKMIPMVSLWNGSVAITYQTAHHWLASIEETVHSSFYSAYDLQNQGVQMPGYGLTNLHLQKQSKNITYDLSINNVFDRHVVQFANYTTHHGIPAVAYYPADGISVLMHIDFNLMPDRDL